jgi:hypothetical protein
MASFNNNSGGYMDNSFDNTNNNSSSGYAKVYKVIFAINVADHYKLKVSIETSW